MADPNINKAYSWAIQTCNAPNVGYSQTYRNQQTVNGVTYYDCSSFVWYALIAGGFDCVTANGGSTWPFTTYTMPGVLTKLGFRTVDASGELLPGDIGLSSGHTEMCYQGGTGSGIFMGAHTGNAALTNQVSIGNSSGDTTYTRSFPTIYRYGDGGATGYGASVYVIAALAGNAWRESHINPTLQQQGGGAFGIFQWDGDRRTALETWLAENGYTSTDPNGQMTYLVVENDWIGTSGGISSLEEFLTSSSTDIELLTTAFCECWERPGIPALDERIDFANKALTYIQEHASDSSISEWETEPQYYLSENQALNNAVLMYRFYSAGGGGGGTPGKSKKKMPIWMWIRYKY